MATPTNIPFSRGRDVTLRLIQNNKPVYVACKSWDVEENATEAADPVNGEDRDRLDKVTNFYTAKLEVYQADKDLMDSIIDAQAADDAQGLPLKQYASVMKRFRDGTRVAYTMKEAKFGPFKDSAGGRGETLMLSYSIRFRYWTPVPSI